MTYPKTQAIYRLSIHLMGWNEKVDEDTPYPRVSVFDESFDKAIMRVELSPKEGFPPGHQFHFCPYRCWEDTLMVYNQLPQPNALLRNEKGFQLVGLGWAGQWSSDVATAVVTAAVDYLDKRDVVPTSFSITFARATPKDLSDLRRFCSELINVLTWQTWGVFDGDPVEVKEKAADLSESALALKIGNWVMQNINLTDGLERVLMGYSLLVNNTCNLESSSLEWRPELALMRSFVEANDDQEKE